MKTYDQNIPKNIPADLYTSIHVTGRFFSSGRRGGGGGIFLMTAACRAYLA